MLTQETETLKARNFYCFLYKNDEFTMDSIFLFLETLKRQNIHPYVIKKPHFHIFSF